MAKIAARQHGVVSIDQLRGAGLSRRTVARWAQAGLLHRVHRGVFALGRPTLSDYGRVMAAALACTTAPRQPSAGSPAVLAASVVASHRSAGFLLGFLDQLPRVIDVTPSNQRGRKVDGVRPHLVLFPCPQERGQVGGIPCTSPARTLVDLAAVLGDASLRGAVERAATKRMLDIAAIEAVLGRGRRRGAKRMRAVVEEWRPAAALARDSDLRSPFEARLLPLLAAERLPLPEVNAPVRVARGTLEVDLLWRERRLVVEADSRRHHGIEIAFERDRKRDRELLDAGYTVIRVTWRQAEREAPEIAASIRRFLAL